MARNVLRQAKLVIYRLKREYGIPASVEYRNTADQYNLETGAITRDLVKIAIKRMILVPQKLKTDFVYDLSFVAANKNFTYGGEFQSGERYVIIDAKDLPKDFRIHNEMYIVFNNRRYHIIENEKSEDKYIWYLKVKQVSASASET